MEMRNVSLAASWNKKVYFWIFHILFQLKFILFQVREFFYGSSFS